MAPSALTTVFGVLGLSTMGLATTEMKTVYRITPRNYTGLTNLDSGDAAGDAFFGIYELQAPIECNSGSHGSSQNLLCRNQPILQIPGFNVYEQFQIEFDSRMGDYAECNPSTQAPHDFECTHFRKSNDCWYDNKDHPEWATEFASVCSKSECTCDVIETKAIGVENINKTFGAYNNASYPKICQQKGFQQFMGYFPSGVPYGKPETGLSETDCCSKCSSLGKLCKAYGYDYASSTCSPFLVILGTTPHAGGSLGFLDTSTGIEKQLQKQTGQLASIFNGTWYSTQAAGECQPGQQIGDGDCYWRVVNMTRNVNASCVNTNLINAAIAVRPACWSACPQPNNITSECWISCLFDTVAGNSDKGIPPMKKEVLVAAFENSFAPSGGCPQVPPCPSPCVPPALAGAVIATNNNGPVALTTQIKK
eukprot:m.53178 g.53178  ORF g.53178 m.53178 type:complete len:422 (+) comp21720_c0_seq1:66-1331(+)